MVWIFVVAEHLKLYSLETYLDLQLSSAVLQKLSLEAEPLIGSV